MKNKLSLIFCPLFCLLIISSCKKEDNKTRKELIQENTCWKVAKFEAKDPETGNFEDYTEDFVGDPCYKDNCYTYVSDGSYKSTEGATKCDPADADLISTGTWSISADETALTITEDGKTRVGKIESLTSDKMVLLVTDASLGGLELRLTYN